MIKNSITNDFYIGSCFYPLARWRRHGNSLKRGNHQNIILQRAFNKYGIENFEFIMIRKYILGEIPRNKLYEIKQQYIDSMMPVYNIAKIVGMPPKASKEQREKLTNLVSLEWIITDPNKNEFKIRNLAKFCRDNNLIKRCMQYVAYGNMKSHKGWMCRKIDDQKQKYQKKAGKLFKITYPDGKEEIIKSLHLFCKNNKLSYSSMINISNKKKNNYNGFLCERL